MRYKRGSSKRSLTENAKFRRNSKSKKQKIRFNSKTKDFKKLGEARKGNRHKYRYLRAKLDYGDLRN